MRLATLHLMRHLPTCRLLASKQAQQQNVVSKEARLRQAQLQQQRQRRVTKHIQASQDGPGDMRPDGPRYTLHAHALQLYM